MAWLGVHENQKQTLLIQYSKKIAGDARTISNQATHLERQCAVGNRPASSLVIAVRFHLTDPLLALFQHFMSLQPEVAVNNLQNNTQNVLIPGSMSEHILMTILENGICLNTFI